MGGDTPLAMKRGLNRAKARRGAAANVQAVGLLAFRRMGYRATQSSTPIAGGTLYLGQSVDLQNLPSG
jgi:hypothetical protein